MLNGRQMTREGQRAPARADLATLQHTGEKLNRCDQCHYASSHATNVRKHMGTFRGEMHVILLNAMQFNGWQMTRERGEGSESVVEEIYGQSNRDGS